MKANFENLRIKLVFTDDKHWLAQFDYTSYDNPREAIEYAIEIMTDDDGVLSTFKKDVEPIFIDGVIVFENNVSSLSKNAIFNKSKVTTENTGVFFGFRFSDQHLLEIQTFLQGYDIELTDRYGNEVKDIELIRRTSQWGSREVNNDKAPNKIVK